MTRFLLSLDDAVDTVFAADRSGQRGRDLRSARAAARIVDIAAALIGGREIPIEVTGIRPGEKMHEIMVSEEECLPHHRARRLLRDPADAARAARRRRCAAGAARRIQLGRDVMSPRADASAAVDRYLMLRDVSMPGEVLR